MQVVHPGAPRGGSPGAPTPLVGMDRASPLLRCASCSDVQKLPIGILGNR
jgi:hypothetical protein